MYIYMEANYRLLMHLHVRMHIRIVSQSMQGLTLRIHETKTGQLHTYTRPKHLVRLHIE